MSFLNSNVQTLTGGLNFSVSSLCLHSFNFFPRGFKLLQRNRRIFFSVFFSAYIRPPFFHSSIDFPLLFTSTLPSTPTSTPILAAVFATRFLKAFHLSGSFVWPLYAQQPHLLSTFSLLLFSPLQPLSFSHTSLLPLPTSAPL